MKFVLYKYESGDEASILYLTSIAGSRPQFSKQPGQAQRYSLFRAFFIGFRYGLSWIPEKYTPNK